MEMRGRRGRSRRRVGLAAGAAAFLLLLVLPVPAGLEPAAWGTAAAAALMAVWWLTEAIPIPATALLPLVLFPLLGAGSIGEVAVPYADPIIFLFLGGFLLAAGMQRHGLHRRVALGVLARSGTRPAALVGGFMGATAFLSMWVSNTATAVMMLPIGLSVLDLVGDGADEQGRPDPEPAGGGDEAGLAAPGFETALMLGIAYAASIGGMGTLIGTPPNAFLAGYLREAHGIEVGFARWLLVGLPIVVVGLPLAWWILTRISAPVRGTVLAGADEALEAARTGQGPASAAERRVGVVFVLTALLWIVRPLLERVVPGLNDAGIAIAGGLALFLLPSGEPGDGGVLDWEAARDIPWGVLILFGGGLSLAAAIERTGLSRAIGEAAAGLAGAPLPLFVLAVTAGVVFLTELTSNTATAAAFLPILGAVAIQVGGSPLTLAVPAALAASCAFMLPVATPPNAVVYGSGRLTIPVMARAGLWLNIAMTLLVTLLSLYLVPVVLGGR